MWCDIGVRYPGPGTVQSTLVDWNLARRIAALAGAGPGAREVAGVDIPATARRLEPEVSAYTGLQLAGDTPPAELVDREQWVDANVITFGVMLEPVIGRMNDRMGFAGPFAGPLRMAAGATVAAEAGLVLGYMSQRVLGQYELSLIQPDAPARLLFVAPNLENAIEDMELDREAFTDWIVLHELTHVLQFGGVPWLRDHLGGLMKQYLGTVEVQVKRGGAGGIPLLPDVSELVQRFREGGLIALMQTGDQRKLMERLQATMAVVEGYSEHVMDALGDDLVPGYTALREAMEQRRRSRSAPEKLLQQLLGLEMKLRQYEVGKRFCDAVVEAAGMDALNRVWESPERIPSLSELEHPKRWLSRVAPPAAA